MEVSVCLGKAFVGVVPFSGWRIGISNKKRREEEELRKAKKCPLEMNWTLIRLGCVCLTKVRKGGGM